MEHTLENFSVCGKAFCKKAVDDCWFSEYAKYGIEELERVGVDERMKIYLDNHIVMKSLNISSLFAFHFFPRVYSTTQKMQVPKSLTTCSKEEAAYYISIPVLDRIEFLAKTKNFKDLLCLEQYYSRAVSQKFGI